MRCVSDITDSRFSAMNAQNDTSAEECTDVTLSSASDPLKAKDLRADRGRSEFIPHPMFDLSEVGLEAEVSHPARMCPQPLVPAT